MQEEESMTRQSSRTSERKAEPTDHKTGPAPLSPVNHETVLRDLHRVLENRKFESVEDANAFLATLTGEGLQDALDGIEPPDPRWQAQELAFDAREATTAERARELAQRALAFTLDYGVLDLTGDPERLAQKAVRVDVLTNVRADLTQVQQRNRFPRAISEPAE